MLILVLLIIGVNGFFFFFTRVFFEMCVSFEDAGSFFVEGVCFFF